ncbi:MAG: hypothetical protein MJZ49_08575 [Bacteroidales bacterium]|nr:hypothetical protein [Bacteroidales bacterium]
MENKKETNWFGRFIGAMLLAFAVMLVLKCTGVVGWSWFWVASPLLFVGLMLFLLFVLYLIVVANDMCESDDDKR